MSTKPEGSVGQSLLEEEEAAHWDKFADIGLSLDQNANSEKNEPIKSDNSGPKMDEKTKLFIKLIYFSTLASIGIINSFFPLFLKSLGLGPSIIGTVLFFRPAGGILAGIIGPTIMSKIRNERKALTGLSILFLIFMFCVGFLPAAKFRESCPTEGFKHNNDPIMPNASRPTSFVQKLSNSELRLADSKYEHSRNKNGTIRMLNTTTGKAKLAGLTTDLSESSTIKERFRRDIGEDGRTIRQSVSHVKTKDNSWLYERRNQTAIIMILSALVFCGEFCFVCLIAAVNSITMRSLGEGNSKQYGVFRSWGSIGHGIGSMLTGAVVTLTVREVTICEINVHRGDYTAMFYVFLSLGLITCLNVKNIVKVPIDGRGKTAQKNPSGDLRRSLCTVRNLSWLFVLFSRSMFYAVTQGFLYWHMDNIGASPILIGFANVITTTTEFLAFFATPKLIERFGETKLVGVGIISYIIRFLLFSVIENPYFILPVEIIEGVAFACIWSSIMSYLSRQVSQESQTQIAGLVQALFMSGSSLGFPLSGALIEATGIAAMFLSFAGMASVTMVIFCLAHVVTRLDYKGVEKLRLHYYVCRKHH